MATLTLLGLPIGNLDDLSLRGRRLLENGKNFLAEDTRSFVKLLQRLGIDHKEKTITSFHDHTGEKKLESLLERLDRGEDFAVVSEAGSAAISDPAYPLVKGARERGHRVTSLPGPSAVIGALEVSGLPSTPFSFHGFLAREEGKKRAFFRDIVGGWGGSHVFFESAARVDKTMGVVKDELPEAQVVIARELTKEHETVHSFVASNWDEVAKELTRLGEFTIIVHTPYRESKGSSENIKELARQVLERPGHSKTLAKLLGTILDEPPKAIYSQLTAKD